MGDHLTAEEIQAQAEAGDRLRDEVKHGDRTRYKIEWDADGGNYLAYRWDGGDNWSIVFGCVSDSIEKCEAKLREIHYRPVPKKTKKELFL